MHTKQQGFIDSYQHFLVNGVKCQLSIDRECLSWSPINKKSNGQARIYKRVNFAQVIGFRRWLPLDGKSIDHCKEVRANEENTNDLVIDENKFENKVQQQVHDGQQLNGSPTKKGSFFDCRKGDKIKVYYSKQNEKKSSCPVLKLKKLIIEHSNTPGKVANTTLKLRPDIIGEQGDVECGVEALQENIDNQQQQQQKQQGDNESNKQNGRAELQVESGPPSCYASEGSNSRLSSLSSSSSSTSQIATSSTKSNSSSPTPIVQTEQGALHTGVLQSLRLKSSRPLEALARQIEASLEPRRKHRPKRLLVFVNPFGGKGRASQLYESQVSRLLDVAGIEAKLVVTKHANHARDTIEDPMFDVELFDGIVCVGGDGMFSELMNGLLFRYNRDQILMAELKLRVNNNDSGANKKDIGVGDRDRGQNQENDNKFSAKNNDCNKFSENHPQIVMPTANDTNNNIDRNDDTSNTNGISSGDIERQKERQLVELRIALGGIGQQFVSPPIPVGVIGAGSTDANSFGLIGTNDVITATLNIILGNQIKIDVCSVHSIKEDRLLRFVSTFVAYGYFGDVIRESEKLRWLGPSRYDVTGINNIIKNRAYKGKVRILLSGKDGSPHDLDRCHANCDLCCLSTERLSELNGFQDQSNPERPGDMELKLVETQGNFVGVNAAITACRCPQTKKGFSPNNHLANGCADLILIRPCSRIQYIQYLLRTGWTKKSAFDLKYVEAYRCRQFEFVANESRRQNRTSNSSSSSSSSTTSSSSSSSGSKVADRQESGTFSSWNMDGEIIEEQSVRVKVNNRLLRVFGTGEPS